MNRPPQVESALPERVLQWLYRDELAHSRMIWRLELDSRLDPPWPYAGLWHDPVGAVAVDLSVHPQLGGVEPPWLQIDADDEKALELLCGVRLPPYCEVLLPSRFRPLVDVLGETRRAGILEVFVCSPGSLGEAALPYEITRLTPRHRSVVAEADWRPEDFAQECDESRGGVRYAILRDGVILSRCLVQPVSRNVAEVADVYTHPRHRRRGYGAALVQGVVRRLHERGTSATYSVHPDNEPSRKLAEAVGFVPLFTWERVVLHRR